MKGNADGNLVELAESGQGPKVAIKKSRFVAFAIRVESTGEMFDALAKIRDNHSKAAHIVHAARIGIPVEWEDASDDGEPRGTGGQPIMNFLRGRDVTNTLVAVVRYYGGVKLGTAGLARAYSGVVASLLENIGTVPVAMKDEGDG